VSDRHDGLPARRLPVDDLGQPHAPRSTPNSSASLFHARRRSDQCTSVPRELTPSLRPRRCPWPRTAHIYGRIGANPAQYVRRPTLHRPKGRGLDRSELGRFLFAAEHFDHDYGALAVVLGLNGLRVSETCRSNVRTWGSTVGTGPFGSWARVRAPGDPPRSPSRTDDRPGRRRAGGVAVSKAVAQPICAVHNSGYHVRTTR